MPGEITLQLGDITADDQADAIVTAANPGLRGGGGVDGAIHRAAGASVLAECRQLGGCPVGQARITRAGHLPAKFIIHAVGPVWHGGHGDEAALLASCHRAAIELAATHDCERVAFPAISTGVYGYPLERAAAIALDATRAALSVNPGVREARFWLFDGRAHEVFSEQLRRILAS
jgi:O-acetyl-ADP-ribose deacetylase (regulator of RNase III)